MAKGTEMAVPTIDEDCRAECDAHTLERAAEVIADKGRLAKAKAHVAKKQQGLDKLFSGLRR